MIMNFMNKIQRDEDTLLDDQPCIGFGSIFIDVTV